MFNAGKLIRMSVLNHKKQIREKCKQIYLIQIFETRVIKRNTNCLSNASSVPANYKTRDLNHINGLKKKTFRV